MQNSSIWHPQETPANEIDLANFPRLLEIIKIYISWSVDENLNRVNYRWRIDERWSAMAIETLDILKKWYYNLPDWNRLNIYELLESSIASTRLVSTEDFELIKSNANSFLRLTKQIKTNFSVSIDTTLWTLLSLKDELDIGKTLVLNFASWMKPGWEFRAWLFTQEDELIISSWLYYSLISKEFMYMLNRWNWSHLYGDQMIYSPRVPIIRDVTWKLLSEPCTASFISSPAVNKRMILKKEPEKASEIDETMIERIDKILSLAIVNWYDNIILWAWWCWAFWNSPEDVSSYFAKLLSEWWKFSWRFKNVIFSIYSKDKINTNYEIFCHRFQS
ncbi:MAG: hypothetical protein ACD_3C00169G0002 [uncultured bacterium (gcode 4)]|uniref:Microbial-type PARG catalytic domain-containing protein n=1 Tax=uncultured bacterium (gcode 4) TaxID=1234023 RepID=K2G0M6_9BACT|nr:MAG: hypothetical protein ACD_3C00169G0002 [uncultured bacterium (gcode 4)]